MDVDKVMGALRANADAIGALVAPVDAAGARWKPSADAWSLVEVVCHLADEEREDFRTRVGLVLRDPTLPWPPIDPQAWVTTRDYAARDLGAALADFRAERERSLAWLASLDDPRWDNAAHHPAGFSLRAGDLMASWLAHDLLHVRQIVELRYGALADGVDPAASADAGADSGTGVRADDAPGAPNGAAEDGDGRWDVRYAGEW